MASSILDLTSQRLKKLKLFFEHKKAGSFCLESPIDIEKESIYKPLLGEIQDYIKQAINENILHKYNEDLLLQLKNRLTKYIDIKCIKSSNIFIAPNIYSFYESLIDLFLQKDQKIYVYASIDFNYSQEVKYLNSGKIIVETCDQSVKSISNIISDIQKEDYKIVVLSSQYFNEQELKDFIDLLPETVVLVLRTSNPIAFNYIDYFNKTVIVLREFPAITTMVEPPICFAVSRSKVIELLNSVQLPNQFDTINILIGNHFTSYDNPVKYNVKLPKNYYKGYDEILSSLIKENVELLKAKSEEPGLLALSKNLDIPEDEIFDFSNGTHFLGISEDLKKYLLNFIKAEDSYNYNSDKTSLKHSLASYCSTKNNQIEYSNILPGAGVTGLLELIAKTFINDGEGYKKIFKEKTLTLDYCPEIYSKIILKIDAINESFALNADLSLDEEQLIRRINKLKPKLVLIDNPRVNTGGIIEKHQMEKIINNIPEETLLVVDESYYKFAEHESDEFVSAVNYVNGHPNLIVLRSFSFLNAFAGLRFGYAVANEQLINLIDFIRNPFDVSPITLALAIKAFDNIDVFENTTLNYVQEQKNNFYKVFSEMGLFYLKSFTNSVLFSTPFDSKDLQEVLLPYKILIKPLNGIYARITISDQSRNDYFLKCLKSVLAGQLHN